jgi:hypothetical protein
MKLVISRYNEDISWSKAYDCVIYNKGNYLENTIPLPNFGREGHTYLHHIVTNYENLDDYTCFLQGNPFDHTVTLFDKLENFKTKNINNAIQFHYLSDIIYDCNLTGCPHHIGLPLADTYEKIFDVRKDKLAFTFGGGAQFIVSKNRILTHSKSFYENIKNILSESVNPIEGYVVERFWNLIFSDDSPELKPRLFNNQEKKYTIEYKKIFNKCYRNNEAKVSKEEFDKNASKIVDRHNKQTLGDCFALQAKWLVDDKIFFGRLTVWELFCKLSMTVDKSDIALYNTNQLIHCVQVYVSMKENGETDKDLLLIALIHDIGKVLSLLGEVDENVDCLNKVLSHSNGLDNVVTSFNHDEFGYFLMKKYVSRPIAMAIKFHSCIPIVSQAYYYAKDKVLSTTYGLTVDDMEDLRLAVKLYEYDHDSKSTYWNPVTNEILDECKLLIDEYFPDPLLF